MDFICQQEAMQSLKLLAEHHQHGVLIVGNPGSGKTYLASQYAKLIGIPEFFKINPVMADLKSVIDYCVTGGSPIVLCIENLDSGVLQISYPLLKLIEDCPRHIYVVVTCNNVSAIPDTVPSRCALVTINPPGQVDIATYAKHKNLEMYNRLCQEKIWGCIRGFRDVDTLLTFTPEQFKYFRGLPDVITRTDSISTMAWKLQHYEDKTETPIELVIRYLFQVLPDAAKRPCIDCLNDLSRNRISKNAIVSKLLFELKYTE